ncbi:MAG: type II toxin-antitoxin system VapC family toxin [Moraxellaceae bacterium]|nr:type II toxin-antitoxin system VapC family toxin [Pseudomonadales bacterium]MCP5176929.1 type II toxin-antitoxin system VapC family toxin [Moraxellaceae bacterium]
MRLLLDTHIFLWFISGHARLSPQLVEILRNPQHQIFVSVISIWECTIKQQLGKLPLPAPAPIYLPLQREKHQFHSLEISEFSLKHLYNLPSIHRDPFDRMLISQALANQLTLVSEDNAIAAYSVPLLKLD